MVGIAGYFFYMIYDIVFTVWDDLKTYTWMKRHMLQNVAVSSALNGRITHLYNVILLGIPMLADKLWVYKLFSYGSILFDVSIYYVLIKKYIDKKTAYLSVLLFFALATFTHMHNLFISYVFCHQILIGIILLSIYYFLKYYDERKRRYLLVSAVLYVAASAIYEGMVPFWGLFLILAWMKEKDKKKVIGDILIHSILLMVWLAVYFYWQTLHPTSYEGGQFYFGDIVGSLYAICLYSIGSFPLLSLVGDAFASQLSVLRGQTQISDLITWQIILTAALTAFVFAKLIPTIQWDKKRGKILLAALLAMFLPNVILGFTSKYIASAKKLIFAYLTSFYSWFFMIIVMLLVAVFLYQKLRWKKPVLVILTCMVFICSLGAGINNTIWDLEYTRRAAPMKAFDKLVSSERIAEVEDNTYIYMTGEFIEFFGYFDLSEYTKIYTDKTIVFTNNPEVLDYNHAILEMRYDQDLQTMELIPYQG